MTVDGSSSVESRDANTTGNETQSTRPDRPAGTALKTDLSTRFGRTLVLVLVGAVLMFICVPVVLTLLASFAGSAEGVLPTGFITLDNWARVLGLQDYGVQRSVWSDLFFSMQLATGGMLVNLIVGVPIAYALTRYDFFAREWLNALAILPLVPGVVLGLAFLRAYPQNASTWFGLVAGYALLKSPFMVLTVQSSFQSMDLQQLEESARSLGASWPRTFLTIIVPNAKRGILAGCIITWLLAAAEFNFTYMVYGNGPRPFAMFLYENITNAPFLQRSAAVSIYFCLVVVAVMVLQLLGNQGFTTSNR